MAGKIKKKDHEKLDDTNIELVIKLLEQPKPITKKEAYERLNIASNPTRLQKIIDDYRERKERESRFRAANRGKPASDIEIQTCISGYLNGESFSDIADGMYRPVSFVKNIIEKIGVPSRNEGDYFHPELLPEACVSTEFQVGQVVWAAKFNALAIIQKEQPSSNPEYKVYQVYVIEPIEEESPFANFRHHTGFGGRYASQRAFDLGSLEHLKKHGVDVYKPLRAYFPNMLG